MTSAPTGTVTAIAVICVALLASGCKKHETPVVEGLRTRTLLVGNQNEPGLLDPHLLNAATDANIALALFEGLTVLDERTAQPLPGAAERWEISPDGREVVFHLRRNGRWSNGDAVTARDFAWSIQRSLTPKLGSEYAYMLWPIRNAEAFNAGRLADFAQVGVTAVDDFTLRLTLERPTPYLLALAAHTTWMPVHRPTIEKFGGIAERTGTWTRPENFVGNGAFTLTEWRPNAQITVTKNPRYRDASRNAVERVVFFPIENADTEERTFRAGQLHVTFSVPPSKIPGYRKESPSRLRIDPLLAVYYVSFNTGKPPLDQPKVRRALGLAIDRAAIVQSVFNGTHRPASTLVPPDCGGYTGPEGQRHAIEAARALLAEAGFPGGRGLPVMSLQVLNDDKLPRVGEALQAMWHRDLGVKITIEAFEQKTWFQNQQTRAYTLGLMGWTADLVDPITFLDLFKAGGGNNWTGWANKTYDALIGEAEKTAEPAARFAILKKAEALLLEEAPLAPISFRARTYLLHPAVKNWEPSPLGIHRYQLLRLAE